MKPLPYLVRSSFYALAALQMACAQALSIAPAQPVPTKGTQVRNSIGSTVNLVVIDANNGQSLPIYQHRGEYWVAGTPGQRYELWMTNRLNDRRQLATTSVDGINVITGETAATLGRGYVLSPQITNTVKGWRKSEHEVAAFNFAAPQASYAAQTGRPANVGVIGVALFPELKLEAPTAYSPPMDSGYEKKDNLRSSGKFETYKPAKLSGANDGVANASEIEVTGVSKGVAIPQPALTPTKNAEANTSLLGDSTQRYEDRISEKRADPKYKSMANAPTKVQQGLGTQHGERVSSYAPTVAFKRASNSPSEVITLRYDTMDNLIARGVLQWPAYTPPMPQPVPTPFPDRGYVPDPPQQH